MKKLTKCLFGAVLGGLLLNNVMAEPSSSTISTDNSKAGDSVVTLQNATPYAWNVLSVFKPTGKSEIRQFLPAPYGRNYNIIYPDQLVCFSIGIVDLGCYSSGKYYIVTQKNGNGKVAIKTTPQ